MIVLNLLKTEKIRGRQRLDSKKPLALFEKSTKLMTENNQGGF